jgi:hypothetical protein
MVLRVICTASRYLQSTKQVSGGWSAHPPRGSLAALAAHETLINNSGLLDHHYHSPIMHLLPYVLLLLLFDDMLYCITRDPKGRGCCSLKMV